MKRLIATSGPRRGSVFPLTPEKLGIGRAADNAVCLDDELVTQHHAAVWLQDGRPYLKDGDSLNGTWVNHKFYSEKFLDHGDRIKIGATVFLYLELEESSEDLPVIINDERDRSRKLETVRVDHTSRGEASIRYRLITNVLVRVL